MFFRAKVNATAKFWEDRFNDAQAELERLRAIPPKKRIDVDIGEALAMLQNSPEMCETFTKLLGVPQLSAVEARADAAEAERDVLAALLERADKWLSKAGPLIPVGEHGGSPGEWINELGDEIKTTVANLPARAKTLMDVVQAANDLRMRLWTDRFCSPVDTDEYRALDAAVRAYIQPE